MSVNFVISIIGDNSHIWRPPSRILSEYALSVGVLHGVYCIIACTALLSPSKTLNMGDMICSPSRPPGQGYINCRYFGVCRLKLLRGDSTPCGEHPLRSRAFRCAPFLSLWIDHQLIESSDMQLWANIYTMEITSDECLTEVRSLLSCRELEDT